MYSRLYGTLFLPAYSSAATEETVPTGGSTLLPVRLRRCADETTHPGLSTATQVPPLDDRIPSRRLAESA